MDKYFSVDELANIGDTTARAVRLYIEKGLLEPMRIGRILCFPEGAREVLENIKRAKRLGFSLDEIKAFGENNNAAEAIRRIERLMSDAENEINHLRQQMSHPIRIRK